MPIRPRFATRLLAVWFLAFAVPTLADDWPGFQGPNRDGVVPDATILTQWPNQGPAVVWSQDVGPGFGGAAIQHNRLYLLDRNDIVGDRLSVYEMSTGKPLWSCDYDAPGRISYHGSRSTPTLTDRFAFTVGPFGHIACFDLKKQQIAWQQHMDDYGAQPPKWAWSQSPLIYQDYIIVAPMADDAGLVALNQDDGRVVWRSANIGNEGYGSPRLVQLHGQTHIVTFTATRVTGVDPDTGALLWSYDNIPVKRAIPTPTPLGDNRLFITAGYDAGSALIEIIKQGDRFAVVEHKRDRDHGGQIHSALKVGEHLYVNLNTNENLAQRGKNAQGLGCLDLGGNLIWKTDNSPDIDRGGLIALGNHLLTLGGEDGVLRLIKADPAGYAEIASVKVFAADQRRNMIWAPLAFANDYLVLRSQNQLTCLDLSPTRPQKP